MRFNVGLDGFGGRWFQSWRGVGLVRPFSSAVPAISLGFTILGETLA